MRITYLITTTICLLLFGHVNGQNRDVTILFTIGNGAVDREFMSNKRSIFEIDSIIRHIDDNKNISYIIKGSSSPDGSEEFNIRLSMQRAENTKALLMQLNPDIDPEKITTINAEIDWAKLKTLIEASNVQYKSEILDIIESVPNKLTDGTVRKKALMDLNRGETWDYMVREFFPKLRASTITFVFEGCHKQQPADTLLRVNDPSVETAIVDEPTTREGELSELKQVEDPLPQFVDIPNTTHRCQWALKTNLALLGVGVSNIAVEISLNRHFSFNLPFVYSPYTINRNWRLQILAIQPEVRYWFGASQMSGHFVGLNSNLAFYNVAINSEARYQDRDGKTPLWSIGFTYGYAVNLGSCLALELMIGAGYANIQYDVFNNVSNGPLLRSDVRHYWGITNAGISLSYKFNRKSSNR